MIKNSYFFLCSTVSSLAARPKSPSRSSMFSLTKKLPEKKRDKNISAVSIPHITCVPALTSQQIPGMPIVFVHRVSTYLVWDLCAGFLCCGCTWGLIWCVGGNTALLAPWACVLPSKCVPGTVGTEQWVNCQLGIHQWECTYITQTATVA